MKSIVGTHPANLGRWDVKNFKKRICQRSAEIHLYITTKTFILTEFFLGMWIVINSTVFWISLEHCSLGAMSRCSWVLMPYPENFVAISCKKKICYFDIVLSYYVFFCSSSQTSSESSSISLFPLLISFIFPPLSFPSLFFPVSFFQFCFFLHPPFFFPCSLL